MSFLGLFKKAKDSERIRFVLPYREAEYWRNLTFDVSAFASPKEYNPTLAMMSFGLAVSCFTSMDLGKNGASNAVAYLEDAGFRKIYVSEDYAHHATSSSLGFVIGERKVRRGKKKIRLYAIGIRGGRYGAEWASNLTLGPEGPHRGFQDASKRLHDEFFLYLKRIKAKGDIAVWTTGYSRAGGVASLFADALSRGLVEGGVEARRLGKARLDIGHIYAYAFASPQAGVYNGDEYSFIHNIVNPEDVVPRLPPSSFGFAHYGYEHFLSLSPEKENEILARFKEEGIDLVPPVFVAMSLDIVHVLDPKRRFKEDFGDTGGQKGFIDRIHGLIEERLSRENYARFVEKGAADLAELVDEQSKAPYRRLLSFFKMVLDGLSEHYGVFSLLNKLTSEKTAWKSLLQPSVSKAIESFPELEEKEEEILTSIAALLHFLCPTTKELLAIYPSLREAENLSAILFAHEAIRYYMLLLGSME